MRTIFDVGMRQSPWNSLGAPLGQAAATPDFTSMLITGLTTGLTTGAKIYETRTAEEIQEEKTEAERLKLEAERARVEAEKAKAAAAAAAAGGAVGGIPTSYLVIGGLGLAAVAVLALVLGGGK